MHALFTRFDVRVSLVYFLVAALWIIASDTAVARLLMGSPELLESVNKFKGLGFVLVTTGALYAVLASELRRRHRLEIKLHYQANLIESVSDAIISTDSQFLIRSWNKAAEALYGWKADEVIGKILDSVVPTKYPENNGGTVLAKFRQDGLWKGEVIQSRRDGTPIHILSSVSLTLDSRGVPTGAVGINRDITDRKRAEQALQQFNQRLVEAQEAERRHIARELHDEVGQTLTALSLMLDMQSRQPRSDGVPVDLSQAQTLVGDLMKRIRELSLDLRPSMLDDLGLMPTLIWHFKRYEQQTGISIDFKYSDVERRFTPMIETTLYRMIQEALTNVARHAQVKSASVRLWATAAAVHAQIADAGVGFDMQNLSPATNLTGGILGLRERAQLAGGVCEIESHIGEGTVINVSVPLQEVQL